MKAFIVVDNGRGDLTLHAAGCADIEREAARTGGQISSVEARDAWAANQILLAGTGHDPACWYVRPKPCAGGVSVASQCACVYSCADDPATACSLSGTFHVHPDDPCSVHPDAPGDRVGAVTS